MAEATSNTVANMAFPFPRFGANKTGKHQTGKSKMHLFTIAAMTPLPLLLAASTFGGFWALAAFVYMTLLAASLDALVARVSPAARGEEFPAANALSITLAFGHFAVLAAAVAGLSGDWLGLWEKVALFLAAGMFLGQVGNSNAHELIHRPGRGLRRLGRMVYRSHLFGHHGSAHLLVHHLAVATPDDPNTARAGESFYRFAPRAWRGSFRKGYRAESERLARRGGGFWRHPYFGDLLVTMALVAAALAYGGPAALGAFLGLSAYATIQLLMSDYVQHYGLTRAVRENGKPEPVGPQHSWDSAHWFTSGMMLNAPRHSDHHLNPQKPYPALDLIGAPRLPYSLPVMAALALMPRHWRRVMDPRLAALTR
jgi:alkane 1-monooxygenase